MSERRVRQSAVIPPDRSLPWAIQRPDLTALAIPAVVGAIPAESWWQRAHPVPAGTTRAGDNELADTAAGLTMGVGSLIAPFVGQRLLDPVTRSRTAGEVAHGDGGGRKHCDHGPLFLLNTLWLLGIVWLPVATALVGQMETDRLQAVLYIGSMLLVSVSLTFVSRYLVLHPELLQGHAQTGPRRGPRALTLLSSLLAVALVVTLIWPGLGYLPLFLLFLFVPLSRIIEGRASQDR